MLIEGPKCEVGCLCWCHADGPGGSAVIYSYVPFFTLCPAAWDSSCSLQAWCAPSAWCRDLLACSSSRATQRVPAAAARDQGHQADPTLTGTGPAKQELYWVRGFSDSAGSGLGWEGLAGRRPSLLWFVSTVTPLRVSHASRSCLSSFFEFLLCVFPCCLCEGYLLKWVGILMSSGFLMVKNCESGREIVEMEAL